MLSEEKIFHILYLIRILVGNIVVAKEPKQSSVRQCLCVQRGRDGSPPM